MVFNRSVVVNSIVVTSSVSNKGLLYSEDKGKTWLKSKFIEYRKQ